jgi:hypothetical protein
LVRASAISRIHISGAAVNRVAQAALSIAVSRVFKNTPLPRSSSPKYIYTVPASPYFSHQHLSSSLIDSVSPYKMPSYPTSILTTDDKDQVKSALPPPTCHILAMARGQIYHAPLTATSPSEWEALDLRGAIVFGRDAREYEILDDASSGRSSPGSLESAETSGSSGSWGSNGLVDTVNEEEHGALGAKDDHLWFRLVEIDPHQNKSSKVVWRQPVLSAGLIYRVLSPSLHGFSGNVSAVFFRFG